MNATFRYCKGSEESRETVEIDIVKEGLYQTTCVVDVDLLLCGVRTFSCRNGDELKVDEILPEMLCFLQAERKKILSGIEIKNLEGWRDSGLSQFEDYCFPGDTVSGDLVDYFVNCVPPVTQLLSCTQVGEAFSCEQDDSEVWRNTYITFHQIDQGHWVFDGYCFKGCNKNKASLKTKIEDAIENYGIK